MDLIKVNSLYTMSTREIAELLGNRHDNLKISVERLVERGIIQAPAMQEFEYRGNVGREYMLDKRSSLILVAQNSPEFTAKIVDRWQELEKAQEPQFKVPTTLSGALRLAAEQAETIEQQALMIEQQKPAVEFVEKYTESDSGSMTFRQLCKILKVKEGKFRDFLFEEQIMYRLNGSLVGYQKHIDAGRFEVKTGTSNDHAFSQCKFTPKGVTWIAEQISHKGHSLH